MPGRTGKQCRERYCNHLRPNVTKGPWSLEDQIKLARLHVEHGNSWSRIARDLPSRSENCIKVNIICTYMLQGAA